jgi:hypothetical protein
MLKVKLGKRARFFEDEDFDLVIRKPDIETELIGPRPLRSKSLRYALMKNHVLITEGHIEFVWGDQLLKLSKGENDTNKIENLKDNSSNKRPVFTDLITEGDPNEKENDEKVNETSSEKKEEKFIGDIEGIISEDVSEIEDDPYEKEEQEKIENMWKNIEQEEKNEK